MSAENGGNVESMFNSIVEDILEEVQRQARDQQADEEIKVSGGDLEHAHGCCPIC